MADRRLTRFSARKKRAQSDLDFALVHSESRDLSLLDRQPLGEGYGNAKWISCWVMIAHTKSDAAAGDMLA